MWTCEGLKNAREGCCQGGEGMVGEQPRVSVAAGVILSWLLLPFCRALLLHTTKHGKNGCWCCCALACVLWSYGLLAVWWVLGVFL